MNKIISRVWPTAAFIVDLLFIIDLASDIIQKFKNKKQTNPSPASEKTEAAVKA